MSQVNQSYTYIGPWTDWSYGSVQGATLTLTTTTGGFLTAFVALLVAGAGGALWTILCYFIHQSRAGSEHQDGLHHQQQNILKNTGSPGGALLEFVTLTWSWRRHSVKPVIRFLPMGTFALLCLVISTLAGTFSSFGISSRGSDTLIRSSNCGYWDIPQLSIAGEDTITPVAVLPEVVTSITKNTNINNAATYVKSCYNTTSNTLGCNIYTKSALSWTANQNASCPFPTGTCYSDNAAYSMDTGPIDSHLDLGINARAEDRITYRRLMTCSTIRTEPYTKFENESPPQGHYYQTLLLSSDENGETYYWDNSLYRRPASNYLPYYELGYAQTNAEGFDSSSWNPIAVLNGTLSDKTALFLASNGIGYTDPVDDPWFATPAVPVNPIFGFQATLNVSTLVCIDQHQVCNPTNEKCSVLAGSEDLFNQISPLNMNPMQTNTTYRLQQIIPDLALAKVLNARGPAALQAEGLVLRYDSIAIPNTQWQIELSGWFNIGLAKIQQDIVSFATGTLGPAIIPTSDTVGLQMCANQKVASGSDTLSFSILNLSLIVVICVLFIIFAMVVDTAVGSLPAKWRFGDRKKLQWLLDGKQQLQRLAFEEAKMGRWLKVGSSIPITELGDKFGLPEDIDPKHPLLSKTEGRNGDVNNVSVGEKQVAVKTTTVEHGPALSTTQIARTAIPTTV